MYKLGTCQYAVLVPLCKEAFANKEFTTTAIYMIVTDNCNNSGPDIHSWLIIYVLGSNICVLRYIHGLESPKGTKIC